MTDLAAWLLEQIAEDERTANEIASAAGGPDWQALGCAQCEGHVATMTEAAKEWPSCIVECCPHEGGGMYQPAQDHMARWDPRRVLAECDAKRRIAELHSRDGDTNPYCRLCESTDPTETDGSHWVLYPCRTLRSLALPYADREGYREEWRP